MPYTSANADYVMSENTNWIRDVWESVCGQMLANGQSEHLLIIDEIQKIENWSEVVKCECDRDTRNKVNIKVVLLGSSRLMLRKGLTESLAGRFELIRMEHWTYQEMRRLSVSTLTNIFIMEAIQVLRKWYQMKDVGKDI